MKKVKHIKLLLDNLAFACRLIFSHCLCQ